uniref:Uncharacterized protein n=1 Tax=Glossina austeni TaxID=7395 RepID=A0A1A9UVS8_GLOAU
MISYFSYPIYMYYIDFMGYHRMAAKMQTYLYINIHQFMLLRRQTMAEWSVRELKASIRFVKLSSVSTAVQSPGPSKSDGRPLLGLSSKLVTRDLKRANHFLHRIAKLTSIRSLQEIL